MNLQQWRDSKGLNITKAAVELGISQPSLSRIEAGEQWPEPETIEKIIANSGGEVTASALHESFMEARRANRPASISEARA